LERFPPGAIGRTAKKGKGERQIKRGRSKPKMVFICQANGITKTFPPHINVALEGGRANRGKRGWEN